MTGALLVCPLAGAPLCSGPLPLPGAPLCSGPLPLPGAPLCSDPLPLPGALLCSGPLPLLPGVPLPVSGAELGEGEPCPGADDVR